MRKPAVETMRPIQTAQRGRPPVKAKASILQVPVVSPGRAPSNQQRAVAMALDLKWCAKHREFLPLSRFSVNAIQHGGVCAECRTEDDRRRREAQQANAEAKAAQLKAARESHQRKSARDKAARAQALENATGERLDDLPTSELEARAIAGSCNPVEVQTEMWENVLWHLQDRERRLGEPAEPGYRKRLIEAI